MAADAIRLMTRGDREGFVAALDAGLDPNALALGNVYILVVASRVGAVWAAEELLRRGADPNISGSDVLAHACAMEDPSFAWRLIREHGADPTLRRRGSRRTPLDNAAWWGHLELARELLDRGCPISEHSMGVLPGLGDIVHCPDGVWQAMGRLLLERGADVTARDWSGASLLMHAADFSEDIAPFMLKAGADPSVIDLHGEYALQLVVCHRLEYLADALARSELPTTDVERFLEVVRQWRWDRRGGVVLWREALSAGHSGAGASVARG
ncbi:hypothetical protein FNF28_05606 [Cafeteria roenbergensis]|uniref:Uncharacterized protein n=1 Tax=Cafeteria roenbergensis TaxID=33653 RepID=A0A5A8D3I9_CAFRO|nr:hypothetical protein FNF28_05606 [Cafeteria roenbergensis]